MAERQESRERRVAETERGVWQRDVIESRERRLAERRESRDRTGAQSRTPATQVPIRKPRDR